MISPQKSREKYGAKLTATINHSPLPVIVEYPDGEELPIRKAYFVGGRAAAIKILVNVDVENKEFLKKIDHLECEVSELKSELQDAKDDKDDAEEELEKWTDAFGDDPEATKTLWDEIEEEIKTFAQFTEISLVANDSENISRLREEYENKVQLLSEADEIIECLKTKLANIEKQANI